MKGKLWSANASIAGLSHYDVDVSVDGGAWQSVVANTTVTSASYTTQAGHSYTFRVTVTDNAGNTASAQGQRGVRECFVLANAIRFYIPC